MKTRVLGILPLFVLLVSLMPAAHAQTYMMCCYGKINLPIDQTIPQSVPTLPPVYTDPFGFTVYTTPVPPYFIYYNLTVEYHWNTLCVGGAYVAGDSTIVGSGDQISQVDMLVQKLSLLTGVPLGDLKGVAVPPGPSRRNHGVNALGPPQWIEELNVGYVCPNP